MNNQLKPSAAEGLLYDVNQDGEAQELTEVRQAEIERFRYSIYIAEQSKEYPSADHLRKRLPDEHDAHATHFICRQSNGDLTGYFRVHQRLPADVASLLDIESIESRQFSIGYMSRLMVAKCKRASGVATVKLLRSAYEYAAATGLRAVVAHASPSLLPIWHRFGNRSFGSFVEITGVGLQQPIVLIIGDTAHLASVGSPLLACKQPSYLSPEQLHETHQTFWPGYERPPEVAQLAAA